MPWINIPAIIPEISSNDEFRDAFYHVAKGVKYTGASTETIELKRPFAQVNVATSDLAEFTELGGVIRTSQITVTDVANTFEMFSEKATNGGTTDQLNAVFTAAAVPSEKLKNVNGKEYDYLAMAYVLVPDADGQTSSTTNITVEVEEEDGTKVNLGYEGATVQRNHRTNLVGSFLTSTAEYDVVVDENFDNDYNYDDTDIRNILTNGGELTVSTDVTLTNTLTIPENVSVKLTLEDGVSISISTGNAIKNNGTLIIEGPGSINSDATYAVNNNGKLVIDGTEINAVYNAGDLLIKDATIANTITGMHGIYHCGSRLVIDNGTFSTTSGNELINNANNTTVIINGGTFRQNGKSYIFGQENAGIIINGGTFYGYENQDGSNDMMRPGAAVVNGGTFNYNPATWLAEGYYILETDVDGKKYYSVVPQGETYENPIVSAEQLKALGNTSVSGTYNLLADIDMTGIDMQPIMLKSGADNSLVFNGNGHTIKNLNLVYAVQNGMSVAGLFNILLSGKEITIKDLTITNVTCTSNKYAGVVLAYNSTSAAINLDNVDVDVATIQAESVSPLVAYTTGPVNLTNCDVNNITMTSEKDEKIGAFVGTANTSTCVVTANNCTNNSQYKVVGRIINDATMTVDGDFAITDADGIYNLAKTVTGDVKITLLDDITLGNETDYCSAVNFVHATSVTIDGDDNTITFKGKAAHKSDTDIKMVAGILSDGEITIKNVTLINNKLSYSGTQTSADRIQVYTNIRGTSVAYENVTFDGGVQVKGSATFTGCNFTETVLTTDEEGYAQNGRFCMFIDHQYDKTGEYVVNLDKCTFNASGYGCVKAAGDNGTKITVEVKSCNFTNTCPSNSWSKTTPKYDVKATGDNITVNDLGGNTWAKGLKN